MPKTLDIGGVASGVESYYVGGSCARHNGALTLMAAGLNLMKRVQYDRYGGPEELRLEEVARYFTQEAKTA